MNRISSLRDRLTGRHGGGGYDDLKEPGNALNETALNEGSHDAWNDGAEQHREPASTRYSSDYLDEDDEIGRAHV